MLTDEDRRIMVGLSVEKAENLLEVARRNLEIDLGTAVGRAYYSQFYAERALLIYLGIDATQIKSHQKTHGELSKIFGKNLPKGTIRAINELQAKRQAVDYGFAEVSLEFTERAIEQARDFLALVKREIAGAE